MVEPKPIIILVEDDRSVLRALRRLLISSGFEVRAFEHAGSVLSIKLPESNACLIFDLHLPGMNGVELFERLFVSGCRLPVIMMTGHVDERTLSMGQRIKAAAFLVKPFGRDLLLNAIDEALKNIKVCSPQKG